MTKLLRIDAEAEEEIAQAQDWYEQQRVGLGAEFWSEVEAAIQSLATPGPECRPALGIDPKRGIRRKLLTRFPHAVVFVETETHVRIISVMHGHRRPAYWRRRI